MFKKDKIVAGFVLILSILFVSHAARSQGGRGTVPQTTGDRAVDEIDRNPWRDLRDYGARTFIGSPQRTTCTTTSGRRTVSCAATTDFQNGDGLVAYKAGPPTTQLTPAAPSVRVRGVTGGKTVHYSCVGVDSVGGLTAASAPGSATNHPSAFGSNPVRISAIARSDNVVKVTTLTAITAITGQGLDIHGVAGFSGFFTVATGGANSFTYTQRGPNVSGTVSGTSLARLENSFPVVSISRTGYTISVTTSVPHHFAVGTSGAPSYVALDGMSPWDLNGYYILLSIPTDTSFTALSSLYYASKEVGSVTAGQSIATVFENDLVSCPTPSASTFKYYVYGDSATGAMTLLGATAPGQRTFIDWGPFQGGGFTAPPYVPTTPPSSAQNGYLATTVMSVNGTNLTLAANAAASVSNAIVLHDDAEGIAAAAANGGTVLASPSPKGGNYVVNSQIVLPTETTLELGTGLTLNETLVLTRGDSLRSIFRNQSRVTNHASYVQVTIGDASTGVYNVVGEFGFSFEGVYFDTSSSNGKYGLVLNGLYPSFTNCGFNAGNRGDNVGLAFIGVHDVASTGTHLTNSEFSGFSPMPDIENLADGISIYGPIIPMLWLRAGDDGPSTPPGSFTFDGDNFFQGRGILLDTSEANIGSRNSYRITRIWDNPGTTPVFTLYGKGAVGVTVQDVTMDTSPIPIVANLSAPGALSSWTLQQVPNAQTNSPGSFTGSPAPGLIARDNVSAPPTNDSFFENNVGQGWYFNDVDDLESLNTLGYKSVSNMNQPLEMGLTYPIFWPLGSTTARVTSVSSNGSVPPGRHSYCVAPVSWTGGWGACSESVSATTTPGIQTVNLSWTSVNGAWGYAIFRDGYLCLGPANGVQTLFGIDTNSTSFADSASLCQTYTAPWQVAAGAQSIDDRQTITPALKLVAGQSSVTLTSDVTQTVLYHGVPLSPPPVFDDFPGNSLRDTWKVLAGGFTVHDGTVGGTSGFGGRNLAKWIGSGMVFPPGPQFSAVDVSSLQNTNGGGVGAAVLLGNESADGYACRTDVSGAPSYTLKLVKIAGGTETTLAQTGNGVGQTGDYITLAASPGSASTILTCYLNGIAVAALSYIDSKSPYIDGLPGIEIIGNIPGEQLGNWSAGVGVPSQLAANTWNERQTFRGGITVSSCNGCSSSPAKKADFTEHRAAIERKTLDTASVSGPRRIDVSLNCTAASDASSVTVTIGWTDTSGAAQTATASANCAKLGHGSWSSLSDVLPVKSGTSIAYAAAVSGTPTFDLHIALEGTQ